MKTTEIVAKANHSKKTFTINTPEGNKYRTAKMSASDFEECLNNTNDDWRNFLKTGSYSSI